MNTIIDSNEKYDNLNESMLQVDHIDHNKYYELYGTSHV